MDPAEPGRGAAPRPRGAAGFVQDRHGTGTRGPRLAPYSDHAGRDAVRLPVLRLQRTGRRLPARRARSRPPDRGALMEASPHISSGIHPAKLVIEGVSKWFTPKRHIVQALDDISLTVAEGEFVCLLGPS